MLNVYHKRNVAIHLIDGGSFYIGASLCSFSVIVPAFVQHYTSSAFLLMLIPFINEFGMYAFQPLAAYAAHRAGRKNTIRLYFLFEFVHRFSFPVIGGVILLSSRSGGSPLPAFYIAYALSNLAWGFGMVLWSDAITLTVPDGIRAQFLGQREFWTRAIGVGASLFAPLMFRLGHFPQNYAYLFIIGGAIFTAGMLPVPKFEVLFPFDEKEEPLPRFRDFMREGIALTLGNKALRPFLLLCLALIASRITYAYMTPYIVETVISKYPAEMRDGLVAALNMAQVVALAAMAYLMGMILDRLTYKAALFIAMGSMAALNVTILCFHTMPAAIAAQVFYGLFADLCFFLPMNVIMDSAPSEKRSLAFASYNVFFVIALGIFSALGSVIAKAFSKFAAMAVTGGIFVVLIVLAIPIRSPAKKAASGEVPRVNS